MFPNVKEPSLSFRSDCFGTSFFRDCMEELLVSEDFKRKAASLLEGQGDPANFFDPIH